MGEIKRNVRKVYVGLRGVYVRGLFCGFWLTRGLHGVCMAATSAWRTFIGGKGRAGDAALRRFFVGGLMFYVSKIFHIDIIWYICTN